ncbi:Ig-like domain-containing protein [Cupriavidus sp.]|uniref:Ig-like domain-containing protein n=1 Tax=Cupriavidus sp. TaxID=1873897 RepID=UPI0025B8CD4A|nr:Ig-like domain-containing protein [Cupriavidus sp.]MCA3186859.1 Ig-like domain-containing protein [Cupriavidus sp.]MCA3192993.1 Ig-like domain-containing protein [Cupriavidus sp.]MCA3195845.1 Ig-like domain-containing protein [Cupriavidus sp.]MCA3204746.1 Ig-like domain-containing protein [Cupriavidus sp.]MCA3206878.1 Ig-like domain-containing protein [Cupriavidus sp.]
MFHSLIVGARTASSCLLAAALLAGCGSGDSGDAGSGGVTSGTPAGRLVVDTSTASPAAGGTITLKATALGTDGAAIKGVSYAWTSSDESVAVVESASDKALASAVTPPVGAYAVVRLLKAGSADITATGTLADGSRVTGVTHLTVQPQAVKTYSLSLSPSTYTVNAGGAPQVVTAVVQRSDGVDGAADLTGWDWVSDNATFVASPAADGRTASVSSPASATLAGSGVLTACASTPAGDRLCAHATLARADIQLPTLSFSASTLFVKPGRTGNLAMTVTDAPGQSTSLAGKAVLSWSFDPIVQTNATTTVVRNGDTLNVTVRANTQVTTWSGTVNVTATYPDGRSSSTSALLVSNGPWQQLVPSGTTIIGAPTAVAVDATRAWVLTNGTLTAGGAQGGLLERFGDDIRADASVILPGSGNGLWLSTDGSTLVTSLAAGPGATRALKADLSGLAFGDFVDLAACGITLQRRSYVVTASGKLVGGSACSDQSMVWPYYSDGAAAPVQLQTPNGNTIDNVLAIRAFGDGTVGFLTGSSGGYVEALNGAPHYLVPGNQSAWSGAIGPGATMVDAWMYVLNTAFVTRNSASTQVWATIAAMFFPVPVVDFRADGNFLVMLQGGQLLWSPASGGGMIMLGRPTAMASAPTRFAMASTIVDGQPKLRVAAIYQDNSVWVYDQP